MLKFNKKKLRAGLRPVKGFWGAHGLWRKIWVSFLALIILATSSMYGIAQWYIHKYNDQPLTYGVSFIPAYAHYLGVDPKETMQAMIDELGVKRFRLVSYWEVIEPSPGKYDFSELDWQFAKAQAAGAKVSLAIGLRQPRWPECHLPPWAENQPKNFWYPRLKKVMKAVIERYKTQPMLESYQLENEYFNKVFGECKDFDRQRLIDEYKFVKSVDEGHKLIISRSNNAIGLPVGQPRPDEFAVSVYKRVWDKNVTKRYYEYPFPAWFYGFLAGAGKIVTGKDMIIHELQAEPWPNEKYDIRTAPIDELYKTLNPERLRDRFEYGRATGMRTIDLWGAEWWYQMKVKRNSPDIWNTAKEQFRNN